jgi:peroxiredoxin Q/BCP
VIEVFPDPPAKVARFHAKQDLNFTLLADVDHAVTERYGVWAEKSM